jgi:DNA invertase Pin-like site-specific DNA recombinase
MMSIYYGQRLDMLIGYARVSTDDQNLHLQKDALNTTGCDKIFEDCLSGSKSKRPGLDAALEMLRAGDTLIIWRLDRLGRSLKDPIQLTETLKERGVGLKSLQEAIRGQLIFHLFAALAEFERNLIRERTNAGLAAARARGRMGGRPKALDVNKRKLAVELYHKNEHSTAVFRRASFDEICQMMGISKPTLYKYVDEKIS